MQFGIALIAKFPLGPCLFEARNQRQQEAFASGSPLREAPFSRHAFAGMQDVNCDILPTGPLVFKPKHRFQSEKRILFESLSDDTNLIAFSDLVAFSELQIHSGARLELEHRLPCRRSGIKWNAHNTKLSTQANAWRSNSLFAQLNRSESARFLEPGARANSINGGELRKQCSDGVVARCAGSQRVGSQCAGRQRTEKQCAEKQRTEKQSAANQSAANQSAVKQSAGKPGIGTTGIGKLNWVLAFLLLGFVVTAQISRQWRSTQTLDFERSVPLDYQFEVDINEAEPVEISLLPGLGPKLSQRIVNSRAEDGPFRSAEDLERVHGIGGGRREQIAPYLEFGISPPDLVSSESVTVNRSLR